MTSVNSEEYVSAKIVMAGREQTISRNVAGIAYHRSHWHACTNVRHTDLNKTRLGEVQRGSLKSSRSP